MHGQSSLNLNLEEQFHSIVDCEEEIFSSFLTNLLPGSPQAGYSRPSPLFCPFSGVTFQKSPHRGGQCQELTPVWGQGVVDQTD